MNSVVAGPAGALAVTDRRAPGGARLGSGHRDRVEALAWPVAAAVCVGLMAVVPTIAYRRFYFVDDTELGAFGVWFETGQRLRSGSAPLLDPHMWAAGNYAAEGQWGLFNPVIMLIGYLASRTADIAVFATAVKLVFLLVATLGTYLLIRGFRTSRPAAFVAAVLTPVAGFTLYMDATSWVTGLFVWAVLPLFWWALRRAVWDRANPLPALLAAYFILTVGYVHGAIALAAVLATTLVSAAVVRRPRAAVVSTGIGLFCCLLVVAVFLPGVLTAAVTTRGGGGVENTGFLNVGLSSLATGVIPTALPYITGFWPAEAPAPLVYVSWIFVLAPFVRWRRSALQARPLAELAVPGVFFLAFVLGPSAVGPLRFPIRMMPYVCLTLVVTFVVAASWCGAARPTRQRLGLAVASVAVGVFFSWSQHPPSGGAALGSAALLVLGVVGLWLLARSRWGASQAVPVAAVVVAVTAGCVLLQTVVAPTPAVPGFGSPPSIADYQAAVPGAVDDVLVIGDPAPVIDEQNLWDQTLLSNMWYLSDHAVQNGYSAIGYLAYSDDLCFGPHGTTCAGALDTLLREDATTGRPLVDLMGVNTIQVLKVSFPGGVRAVPDGWRVAFDSAATTTWVRDVPGETAGGVVWSTPGSVVRQTSRSASSVTFEVSGVGPDGADVVLSRLAWPGYDVTGGTLAEPVRGYLLTVHVPPGGGVQLVSAGFRPPGWTLELAALAAAVVGALGWSAAHPLLRRRRRG